MHHHSLPLRETDATSTVFLRKLWRAFRIWITTIVLSEFISLPVILLIGPDDQNEYDISYLIPVLYVLTFAVLYSLIAIPFLVVYLYVEERIITRFKKHLFRVISCGFIFCCAWLHGAIYQDDSIISMLSSWDAIDYTIAIIILLSFYASLYIHQKKLV